MPEERMSTPSNRISASVRRLGGISDLLRRTASLNQFIAALAIGGLISAACYLVVYLRTGAWQMIVVGGTVVFGLVLAAFAFFLARRGRDDAAGYVVLLALAIVYATAELTLLNATLYLVVSGMLLMFVGGSILLPRRWLSWLLFVGYLGLSYILINQFEPLPRFDIQGSPLLRVFVPVGSTLLTGILIWQAVLVYGQVRTIRARLVTMSITTVLLTAVAISTTAILVGVREGREQAIDRLELIASLREVEIDGWITDIRDTLAGSLQQAPEHRFVAPEMANVVATLLDSSAGSQEQQDSYGLLAYNFQQWLKQADAFEAVFFMDRNGKVVVSTDPEMEGQILVEEIYFQRGTVGTFLAPPVYDESMDRVALFASRPILGEYGRLLGVLAGRVDASTLDRRMRLRERANLGETGESYLVGKDRRMLTDSRFGDAGRQVRTEGVEAALEREEEGAATYLNYQGSPVIGVYRWIPDLQVVLVAEQTRAEAFRAVNRTTLLNGSIALVAVLVAGALSLTIARTIHDPMSELAEVASDIAAGDLERRAEIERQDEIGTLATAFNTMTARLRGLIGQLEQRVAERTRELQTRSAYLEASAEVGRAASTMLDAESLVQAVVDLVQERFDFYYVGLFLLGETSEWAELQAGTGEAGRQQLLQKHRLKVGGESMIGRSIARREARIALDVGDEPVRFDNPLLPMTRSEAALPLQSRGRVFGAMTVQSEKPGAFDEDTVTVLQTMADQVAVALDNAYLFAEAEESLQAARRASAALSREGWGDLLRSRPVQGYHSDERGVVRAETVWRPEMEEAIRAGSTVRPGDGQDSGDGEGGQPLAIPIKVAGKVIGVLDTYKPQDAGPWTDEEVETLESLVEQLAVSLESARLYQETQTRAAREQMVAQISSQLRSSLDPDTILKTAVRELGRALDVELASVELRGSSGGGDGDTSPDRGGSTGMEEG